MTNGSDRHARLTAWLRERLPDLDDVQFAGAGRMELGYSAEMLLIEVACGQDDTASSQELVVKLRPPSPGLLEPYDLGRQFRILQALESTDVRVPRALWVELSPDVLGREFYVMERALGDVYEQSVPPELDLDPQRIPRMCEGIIDQLAALHSLDPRGVGLNDLGDGATYVDRELARWCGEMSRVQMGPLPALERLRDELIGQRPQRRARITLVHGDVKPGNFAFVGDQVSAFFDWEMADMGDPMADVGYLELMWSFPVGITSRPTAPAIDEMLSLYEARTGFEVAHRSWYRAFQAFKTAIILLIGSMLFETGHSDDVRYLEMALGVDMITQAGLRDVGVEDQLESGPVLPTDERISQAMARTAKTAG